MPVTAEQPDVVNESQEAVCGGNPRTDSPCMENVELKAGSLQQPRATVASIGDVLEVDAVHGE
jgi:hypothetical protein